MKKTFIVVRTKSRNATIATPVELATTLTVQVTAKYCGALCRDVDQAIERVFRKLKFSPDGSGYSLVGDIRDLGFVAEFDAAGRVLAPLKKRRSKAVVLNRALSSEEVRALVSKKLCAATPEQAKTWTVIEEARGRVAKAAEELSSEKKRLARVVKAQLAKARGCEAG